MASNLLQKKTSSDSPGLYDLAFCLLEQSNAGIILIDRQHQIIVWNDWIAQHTHIAKAQAVGMGLFSVFNHLYTSRFKDAVEKVVIEQRTIQLDAEADNTILPLTYNLDNDPRPDAPAEPLYHQVIIKPLTGVGSNAYTLIQIMEATKQIEQQNQLDKQGDEISYLFSKSAAQEYQLDQLFEKSYDAVIVINKAGQIKAHNPAALMIFEYNAHEFSHLALNDFLTPAHPLNTKTETLESDQQNKKLILNLTLAATPFNGITKDNFLFPVDIRHDISPEKDEYILIIKSNAQLHDTVKSATIERNRAQSAFHAVSDAVITIDADNHIAFLNPAAEQLCACSKTDAVGKHFHSVIRLTDEQNKNPIIIADYWATTHQSELPSKGIGAVLSRMDHFKVPVELTIVAATDEDGHNSGLAIILRNISQQHDFNRKMAWHTTHDQLTGLLNRSEFESRLERKIKQTAAKKRKFALLYIDVDQFKVINDTIGHVAGDELLAQITNIIKPKLRPDDLFARMGGDEFGILLLDCAIVAAHKIAQDIRQSVQDYRFEWKNKSYSVSISIGLAPVGVQTEGYLSLLTHADAACFAAKDSGRNRVHIYEMDNQDAIKTRNEMQWISRLQNAMDNNEMLLFCQEIRPAQQNIQTKSRLEILLRIADEDRLASPAVFIPAAERYNLMPKVDRWVLQNTFDFLKNRDLSKWEAININLSGQSLGDESFLYFLIECVKQAAIRPNFICFEITETAAIADLNSAANFMEILKKMGCQFALDDFGTGLSSFSYLKNLPIDFLKIDGAFVKEMNNSHADHALLEAINHIGHVMGIKTIAEYVETVELLDQIKRIGVDYVQGYAISMPAPLEEYF